MHSAGLRPHSFHPHRIQVPRHNPYEVITLADNAVTHDGASPAHGSTPQLHGNLARATGWAYVAFVLDVYSRTIVSWQVANHMWTELPLDALEMALWRRTTEKDSGLIHHSDRRADFGRFLWAK
ncbi:DDE-type integrase/transposase/recombinase [Streptomyces sp. NPDC048558]|uniref:DDE-type integrase/transposase/recombinase n=1 Tax=Streptomyces sp. NPDC048558 TaxID=3155759 RepID=UPI003422619D